MRLICVHVILLVLVFPTILFAQSGDSNYFDISPQFQQGKNYRYDYIAESEGFSMDSLIFNVKIKGLATIQPLTITDTSYTLNWNWSGLTFQSLNKSDFDVASLLNGVNIIYQTNKLGKFEKVDNIDDLKKLFAAITEGIGGSPEHIEKEKARKTTREAIETEGLQEIRRYHSLFGNYYKLLDSSFSINLPINQEGDIIPVITHSRIFLIGEKKELLAFEINQAPDPKKVKDLTTKLSDGKELINEFALSMHQRFLFNLKTGIVEEVIIEELQTTDGFKSKTFMQLKLKKEN